MAAAIRIIICDDHALVRSGLRKLLESELDLEVIGEAANAEEAIDRARADRPDVLVLDVVMPGRSGIDALPDILAAAPSTRVLMLSMQDDPAYARRAFAAGARGYVLKDAADTELVRAIHAVSGDQRYVHPVPAARLATPEAPTECGTAHDRLSDRELEVLHLLALGHTNQEIAKMLFVSVRRAEGHRARVVHKLGLKTRAEIVQYALEAGELDHGQRPRPS